MSVQKRTQQQNGHQVDGDPRTSATRGMQSLLSPIKSEPITDGGNTHLYRFSPSPAPSMRYHSFQQADVRSSDSQSQSTFDSDPRSNYASNTNANGYHSSNSPTNHYSNGTAANGAVAPTAASYSENGSAGAYTVNGSDEGKGTAYGDHYRHNSCPCRTNPALGLTYITLSQTLQSSLNTLRQYSHHPSNSQCSLLRRIVDLNNALQ